MTAAPMKTEPRVKGWCPGAHRPMMSGDGLVVRVRPRMGRLDAAQVLRLCDLARTIGSGTLDLTSRANLQIRGVTERDHPALLDGLLDAGLLDDTPDLEARRNILVTPDWTGADLTERLHAGLLEALPHLPDLPAKMGIALDTGAAPLLQNASADFRFERGAGGSLILRADGADTGGAICETDAPRALQALAEWFVRSGGRAAGRMARHVAHTPLPQEFTGDAPAVHGRRSTPAH